MCMIKHTTQVLSTQLRYGRVTHLKINFAKNYIFLLPTYLVYQSLFCGTLIMSSIDLATRFKTGMYQLNREKHY